MPENKFRFEIYGASFPFYDNEIKIGENFVRIGTHGNSDELEIQGLKVLRNWRNLVGTRYYGGTMMDLNLLAEVPCESGWSTGSLSS